jgi:hypothetical protein
MPITGGITNRWNPWTTVFQRDGTTGGALTADTTLVAAGDGCVFMRTTFMFPPDRAPQR